MTSTRDLASKLRINNTHNIVTAYAEAHPDQPMPAFIHYRPATTGRGSLSAAWQIVKPGFKTDPDAPWYNYGHKTFWVFVQKEKNPALVEAKAEYARRYGETEFVTTGLGGSDLIPVRIRTWFRAQLKTVDVG